MCLCCPECVIQNTLALEKSRMEMKDYAALFFERKIDSQVKAACEIGGFIVEQGIGALPGHSGAILLPDHSFITFAHSQNYSSLPLIAAYPQQKITRFCIEKA